jgi:hypothetical protein
MRRRRKCKRGRKEIKVNRREGKMGIIIIIIIKAKIRNVPGDVPKKPKERIKEEGK